LRLLRLLRLLKRLTPPGRAFPLAVPAVIAAALLAAACNRVYYQPTRRSHGDAAPGHRFSDHYFLSGSGSRLHGRLFPRGDGTPAKGLWVFFHGSGRNLSGGYSLYHWVTDHGWDYFIFDYSGYGRSTGEAGREAVHRDGIAALELAAASLRREGGQLVLAGESLGGAVLLGSAAAWEGRRQASAIFVDCAFPSYRKVARAVMDARFYAWPFQFLGPLLVSDDHAPERGLDSLGGIPVLVTHCRQDDRIPYAMGEALYAAAPEPKAFWSLEGCGHTEGFTDRFPAHRERLLAFMDSLPAPAPVKADQADQAGE
jgi:fermentation-respiration switch protein FrsA (DUF1100 family)